MWQTTPIQATVSQQSAFKTIFTGFKYLPHAVQYFTIAIVFALFAVTTYTTITLADQVENQLFKGAVTESVENSNQ